VSESFAERLKKGLQKIEATTSLGSDDEAIEPLHRSLERTLARLAPGSNLPPSKFRFQVTGGKPLLFQNIEALPMEPTRLLQLLNTLGVSLQPGETIEVDGALAAWVLRGEANITESNLRVADTQVRTLNQKHGRDRDHAAAQNAESTKIRLRGRLTQLVSALQIAQKESESGAAPAEAADQGPAEPAPPPPPKPAPVIDKPPTPEVLADVLTKMLAVVQRCNVKAAVVGELAFQVYGSAKPALRLELMISSGFSQRETVLGAARAEGISQMPNRGPLNLRYADAERGCAAPVDIIEATNPFQKQVLSRAQPGSVFEIEVPFVSKEDLVLLRVGSELPADRERVVELLRNLQGMDSAYIKKEAMAAGLMDAFKEAWAAAKEQPA
jgi:hypothetical protein